MTDKELLTIEDRVRILVNAIADDRDPPPVLKLFTPDAAATWLISEVDPDDPDRLFGLCDLGLGFAELGYVSLAELSELVPTAFALLLIVLLSVRTVGHKGEQCCGGESVSQSPLKDTVFSTFLEQDLPFGLPLKWNSAFDKNLSRSMARADNQKRSSVQVHQDSMINFVLFAHQLAN
jgi:hypothetical protein